MTLASLARLYFAQGQCAEAEPYFKKSSSMFDKLGGIYDLHISILESMAECYKKSGKISEAKEYEERAKEIKSKYQ